MNAKKTLFSALAIACATANAIAEITTITDCTTLTPEAETAVSFGQSVAMKDNLLFVGAGNNQNGNFVNIYDVTKNELLQTIYNPTETKAFFGYQVAVSNDILIVTASTAKTMYSYKLKNGKWGGEEGLPSDNIALDGTPNNISFNDSKIAVSTMNPNITVYTIDSDGKFSETIEKTEDITKGAGCYIKNNILIAIDNAKSINIYEYQDNKWVKAKLDEETEASTKITTIGSANATSIVYEDNVFYIGNHKDNCIYSLSKKNTEWEFKTVLSKPQNYTGSTFGRNISIVNGILVVSGNTSDSEINPIYVYKKTSNTWNEILEAKTPMKIGTSLAYNGSYIVASNMTTASDDGANQGSVYVFNIKDYIDKCMAISNIQDNNSINDNTIYDLQGRVVKNPSHGIYIQNHKLIMIK